MLDEMLDEMIDAIKIDCAGEGCSEEETNEVIQAFLTPLIGTIEEHKHRASLKEKFLNDCRLPD